MDPLDEHRPGLARGPASWHPCGVAAQYRRGGVHCRLAGHLRRFLIARAIQGERRDRGRRHDGRGGQAWRVYASECEHAYTYHQTAARRPAQVVVRPVVTSPRAPLATACRVWKTCPAVSGRRKTAILSDNPTAAALYSSTASAQFRGRSCTSFGLRRFMPEVRRLVCHAAGSAENIQQAKAGAESAIRGFGKVGRCVAVRWAGASNTTAAAEAR